MLERCVDYKLVGGGAEPIVIDQAVDFLQALLDLLTEVHVHLEVCRLLQSRACTAGADKIIICSHFLISDYKYVGWRPTQLTK